VKALPDFLKDPYGNPFESEELRAQFNVAAMTSGNDDDDVDDEKSNFEEPESEEVNFSGLECGRFSRSGRPGVFVKKSHKA
jgi:hypothetical protein